ncbi:hypothetical protein BDR03DRAFT_553913 [Suillus americanus]|nr:hypothetical protein BDR03DRAFT_553913 [Suillus americanus]
MSSVLVRCHADQYSCHLLIDCQVLPRRRLTGPGGVGRIKSRVNMTAHDSEAFVTRQLSIDSRSLQVPPLLVSHTRSPPDNLYLLDTLLQLYLLLAESARGAVSVMVGAGSVGWARWTRIRGNIARVTRLHSQTSPASEVCSYHSASFTETQRKPHNIDIS